MEQLESKKIKEALSNHGIIAFPTETVMGLGVYFDDEEAFHRLNDIKNRIPNKPYTLMLDSTDKIGDFAKIDGKAYKIIEKFMPGPITILLNCNDNLPFWLDMGTGIIGIRVPSYSVTLDVLKAAEKPLLVPSANKRDDKPAKNSDEVIQIFEKSINYVVEGECLSNIPSTIIDLTKEEIKIIRQGNISIEDIKRVVEEKR